MNELALCRDPSAVQIGDFPGDRQPRPWPPEALLRDGSTR